MTCNAHSSLRDGAAWILGRLLLCLAALLQLTACPQNEADKPGEAASTAASTPPPVEAKGSKLVLWVDPVLEDALNGLSGEYRKLSRGGSYKVVAVERSVLRQWAASGETGGLDSPDLLLFGGEDDYGYLLQQGAFDEASARTFAGDRLVVIKPLKSSFASPSLFDCYRLRFKELQVADFEGSYLGLITHQALTSDGLLSRVKDRIKPQADSRSLADGPGASPDVLAICFASQAGAAAGIEPMLLIDSSLHEAVQFKAAAVRSRAGNAAAVALLRWLAEDSNTQRALGGYGLLDRATALNLKAAVAAGGSPSEADQAITAEQAGPAPEGASEGAESQEQAPPAGGS